MLKTRLTLDVFECYLQNMLASDLSHSSGSSHTMEAQCPSKVRASAIVSLLALLHVRKTCVAGRAGAAKRSLARDKFAILTETWLNNTHQIIFPSMILLNEIMN